MTGPTTLLDFPYRPLDSTRSQIRILQVHPDLENGLIKIAMKAASVPDSLQREANPAVLVDPSGKIPPLPQVVNYQCLSYCWGTKDNSCFVHVFDTDSSVKGQLLVRPNLHAFLAVCRQRAVQSTTEPVWWWIDALCINQRDNGERAQQVQRMGMIYRRATAVYIWLGHEPQQRSLISHMASMASQYTDWMHVRGRHLAVRSSKYKSELAAADEQIFRTVQKLGVHKVLLNYGFICDNPYWKRLWIIQEIALAEKLYILARDADITFTCLADGMATFGSVLQRLSSNIGDQQPTIISRCLSSELMQLRDELGALEMKKSGSQMPVYSLLAFLAPIQPLCMDGRDQVYGILALADFPHGTFQVTYDKDVWELAM